MSYKTGYVVISMGAIFLTLASVKYVLHQSEHPNTSTFSPMMLSDAIKRKYAHSDSDAEIHKVGRIHGDPYGQRLKGVKELKGWKLEIEKERQLLETASEIIKDWSKFGIREDQNCTWAPRFFDPDEQRPIIAISSFPGSGNTWARHLIHMASGYWTGNRRGSNHLKQYGWRGEDADCKDRTTIAQKTHRLNKNQRCEFERGLVVIRNPFDAILAAFNHHKAGKTGEPDYSVYSEGTEWVDFVLQWIYRWTQFHQEWVAFEGPVLVSCFETLRNNLTEEVGKWLTFMDFDDRRLGCVNYDPVGQFYRHKTKDYSHIYTPDQRKIILKEIKTVSKALRSSGFEDCTQYFNYDKCCNNGDLPF